MLRGNDSSVSCSCLCASVLNVNYEFLLETFQGQAVPLMCFVGGKYKGNSVIMQGRRVTRYTDSWLDCDTVHEQRNIWVPLLFYAKFEHPGLSMVRGTHSSDSKKW